MLYLRPFKPCDAKRVVNWFADEKSFNQWSAGRLPHYPITAEALLCYYAQNDDNPDFFVMSAFDGSGLVGQLMMRFTDNSRKTLRFGHIIVSPECRGKGYGKEMLTLAQKYAFSFLGAEKVTLGVFENNPAAYHCYKSVGFCEAPPDCHEVYEISGEKWKCIEMFKIK